MWTVGSSPPWTCLRLCTGLPPLPLLFGSCCVAAAADSQTIRPTRGNRVNRQRGRVPPAAGHMVNDTGMRSMVARVSL